MNTELLLPILGEFFAKGIAVLLTATLIARRWRRASAAQRHFVWLAALMTLLLLPMTRLLTPRWKVSLERPTKISVPAATLPMIPPAAASDGAEFSAPAPHAPTWLSPDWRTVVASAWGAGVALLLGSRLLGSWRLRRLEKTSTRPSDPRMIELAQSVFRELGIARPVRLRVSSECRVPMTWGVRRPVLVLPGDAQGWSDARLAAALRHEAGHIRRQDYLARWVAHLVCALYWPNPLVWLTARSLRVAQEQATDDLVLRAGTPPEEYAAQLFDAARTVAMHGLFAPHAVAMATPSTLENRVLAIVDGQRDRRPLSGRVALIGVTMALAALAICTAAQLRGAEPPPAPGAAGGKAGPAEGGPQVLIQAKFIEMDSKASELVQLTAKPTVYTDPQFQVIIRALNQTKGADLLSAPNVVTRSDRAAVIEIIREFTFPTDWKKDVQDSWESKSSDTKKLGVTLEVTPKIAADGVIELQLKSSVVDFVGFTDLDDPKREVKSTARLFRDIPATEKGKRLKPNFSERRIDVLTNIKSGETVALAEVKEAGDAKPSDKTARPRKLFLFVTATTVAPDPRAEAKAVPSPSPMAERAAKIIIPKLEFREATVPEALGFLQGKALELDPEKKGVNFVLKQAPESDAKITVSLTNIPLAEALRYVASLAGLELVAEPEAIVLRPPEKGAGAGEKPSFPAALPAGIPAAIPVPGKPGFVTSPYDKSKGYIDVRGFPEGTEVKDPFSGKSFLVPPLPAPDAGKATPKPADGLLQQTPKESRIEGRAGIEIRSSNPALNRGPIGRRPGDN